MADLTCQLSPATPCWHRIVLHRLLGGGSLCPERAHQLPCSRQSRHDPAGRGSRHATPSKCAALAAASQQSSPQPHRTAGRHKVLRRHPAVPRMTLCSPTRRPVTGRVGAPRPEVWGRTLHLKLVPARCVGVSGLQAATLTALVPGDAALQLAAGSTSPMPQTPLSPPLGYPLLAPDSC